MFSGVGSILMQFFAASSIVFSRFPRSSASLYLMRSICFLLENWPRATVSNNNPSSFVLFSSTFSPLFIDSIKSFILLMRSDALIRLRFSSSSARRSSPFAIPLTPYFLTFSKIVSFFFSLSADSSPSLPSAGFVSAADSSVTVSLSAVLLSKLVACSIS